MRWSSGLVCSVLHSFFLAQNRRENTQNLHCILVSHMAPCYMGKNPEKLWESIQNNFNNVKFNDFCRVIKWFGFVYKGGRGSHEVYFKSGIQEIIDVQKFGNEAKPYQIRQFINLVQSYQLKGGDKK